MGARQAVVRWGAGCVVALAVLLAGCSGGPPSRPGDACAIFDERDDWYEDARESYQRWGVPIAVQLAIVHQESRFDDDAKPPRTRLFWFVPWKRPSSAYGYAQVIDGTWDWYRKETGHRWADRDDFGDVCDFIGWYGDISYRKLGIPKTDAYRQYLAYHEGHGGYRRGTYRAKGWLVKVARKVQANAKRYEAQLAQCEERLRDRGWWPFW